MPDRTEGGGVSDRGIHAPCPDAASGAPANTMGRYGTAVFGKLKVGGFVPLSTTDFPGKLAAVVFGQGCPWRCAYCHNPHLQPARGEASLDWQSIIARLERRRGLIDAVVFSGGEPTAQAALPYALQEVRGMGFGVGLHTAGMYPRRLRRLLPLTDWVGFDVKTLFSEYKAVAGVAGGARALESLHAVLESGVDCEFRTTVHPDLIKAPTLRILAATLARLGVKRYVLQEFRGEGCADARLRAAPAASYLDDAFCGRVAGLFESFEVRRAP